MPSHFTTALFPHLLSFPLISYFLLRVTLAYCTGCMGWMRFKKLYPYVAIFEIIAALFVGIGFYTQGALLAVILILIFECWADTSDTTYDSVNGTMQKVPIGLNKQTIIILIIIALSLMLTGPGVWAFDLPL